MRDAVPSVGAKDGTRRGNSIVRPVQFASAFAAGHVAAHALVLENKADEQARLADQTSGFLRSALVLPLVDAATALHANVGCNG